MVGLAAYYPLDDLTDVVSGAFPLTNVGGVTFGPGKVRGCAIFSSGTGKLTQTALRPSSNGWGMSWSFWFRTNLIASAVMVGEATGIPSFRSDLQLTGTKVGSSARPGGLLSTTSASSTLGDSVWHHNLTTYNQLDGKLRQYVDGKVAVVSAPTTIGNIPDNGVGIRLGGDAVSDGIGPYGSNSVAELDEVGIWLNTVLSPSQAILLWNGGTPPQYPFVGMP